MKKVGWTVLILGAFVLVLMVSTVTAYRAGYAKAERIGNAIREGDQMLYKAMMKEATSR